MAVQPLYRATSWRSTAPPNLTEISVGFCPFVGHQYPERERQNAVHAVDDVSSAERNPEAGTWRPADDTVNETAAQNRARKELPEVAARTPPARRANAEARVRKRNWRPHCQQPICLRAASYASSNEEVPAFCEKHKLDGMQNVVHPNRGNCIHEGCARVSSYASTGDTVGNFCHLHKEQGMVKVRDKIGSRCEETTCLKQASFAVECQRYPRFCKDHKQQGMINIRHQYCLALGCSRGASFAVDGDQPGIYCGEHKLAGMVNTPQRWVECPHQDCGVKRCLDRVTSDAERRLPAGIRASEADTNCERFRNLVNVSDKQTLTDSQTSGADARRDYEGVGYHPSEADPHSDTGAVGHRGVDAGAHIDNRDVECRPSAEETRCYVGLGIGYTRAVGDRRWSLPPSTSTRTAIQKKASVFVNSKGNRCYNPPARPVYWGRGTSDETLCGDRPAHCAIRASDLKRSGSQPAHPFNRGASGTFSTDTAVRAGRGIKVEVVAKNPLPDSKTFDNTHRGTFAVDCHLSNYNTHKYVGIGEYRRWSTPPSTSSTIERNENKNVCVNGERNSSQPVPRAKQACDGERCGRRPAYSLNLGASGIFSTEPSFSSKREFEVVAEVSSLAAETSINEFNEQAGSSSDHSSPQFVESLTDRTKGIRLRFRAPYASSSYDTQSTVPDIRRETRQASPSANEGAGYAPPEPDTSKGMNSGQLPEQESTAVGKRANVKNNHPPGYARTPFYFNLVKALTKK